MAETLHARRPEPAKFTVPSYVRHGIKRLHFADGSFWDVCQVSGEVVTGEPGRREPAELRVFWDSVAVGKRAKVRPWYARNDVLSPVLERVEQLDG